MLSTAVPPWSKSGASTDRQVNGGESTLARSRTSLIFALAFALSADAAMPTQAGAQTIEVLGTARTNNRIESIDVRIAAHQAHVSAICIRSGSLATTLLGIEIEFADGSRERIKLQERLAPGQQSRPIPVDPRRAVRRVFVTKKPGLRPGETVIQILGKVQDRR